jgi:hypothetical protein
MRVPGLGLGFFELVIVVAVEEGGFVGVYLGEVGGMLDGCVEDLG